MSLNRRSGEITTDPGLYQIKNRNTVPRKKRVKVVLTQDRPESPLNESSQDRKLRHMREQIKSF